MVLECQKAAWLPSLELRNSSLHRSPAVCALWLRCQPEHLGKLQEKGTGSPLSRESWPREGPEGPALAESHLSYSRLQVCV